MKDKWNDLWDRAARIAGYFIGAMLLLEPLRFMSLEMRWYLAPIWMPASFYLLYKAYTNLPPLKDQDQ